jgi:hypothetical protein
MKSLRELVSIGVLLLWGTFLPSGVRASDCGPALYRRVTAALKDPGFKAQAGDWVRRYQRANPTVHRGMLKAAIHKDVKALQEGFRDLPLGANPFSDEDDIYRVIGELTDANYVGAPGLSETVGNLFADTSPNEKGALLTLLVADRNRLASKLAPGNGAGLEQTVAAAGVSRKYDMREPAAGAGVIGGIVHENKNWPEGLPGYPDALPRFMDEFRRDVIIHGSTSFAFYRLNFRSATKAHQGFLRDELLKQFDDPSVIAALGDDLIRVRDRFIDLWNAGDGGGLLRFY